MTTLKILALCFTFCLFSCDGLKIMDRGNLEHEEFSEEIRFEDPLNLIIIPVEIQGNTYRFIFDTGAPNVISNELQQKHRFKTVGKNKVRDSEGKSQKIKYVKLDNVKIGNINFSNTAAFVTDMNANPFLACLDLDGIIGSNLMQFCTWRVDFSTKKITFTDQPKQLTYSTEYRETSFNSDTQHAIKIDFKTANAKITNLKVDYGSTNSIGVPNNIYNVLIEKGDLFDPLTEVGFSQSGIFGDFLVDTTESSVIQSGQIGDFSFGKIEIENGGRGLLGTSILKNYIVTMNWQNSTIGFDPIDDEIEFQRNSFGLSPTFHNGNTIVKSVIVDGPAFKAGLEPGMIIRSIDEFKLGNHQDFCDYILADKGQRDSIVVKVLKNDVLETYEITSNIK